MAEENKNNWNCIGFKLENKRPIKKSIKLEQNQSEMIETKQTTKIKGKPVKIKKSFRFHNFMHNIILNFKHKNNITGEKTESVVFLIVIIAEACMIIGGSVCLLTIIF